MISLIEIEDKIVEKFREFEAQSGNLHRDYSHLGGVADGLLLALKIVNPNRWHLLCEELKELEV